MKTPQMKAALKKCEAKAKKKVPAVVRRAALTQEEACVEVVADLQAKLNDNAADEIESDDVQRSMKKHGVTKEFLQEALDSRTIEKENQKKLALAGLKAAYKKLPKHLKEIIDNMDSEEMCDSICDVED